MFAINNYRALVSLATGILAYQDFCITQVNQYSYMNSYFCQFVQYKFVKPCFHNDPCTKASSFDCFYFLGYSIWKVALAIHVTAWILQFIGHGVFEGRAPALLDSLDQVNGSKIKVYVNKVNRVNAFSCDKVIFSYQILNFSSTVSTPDEPY